MYDRRSSSTTSPGRLGGAPATPPDGGFGPRPAEAEVPLEYLRYRSASAGPAWDGAKRELRVMFSRKHQPIPVRIAKWAVFLGVARLLRGTGWFRAWVFGLPLAGAAMHLLYRRGTRGWTRPWGGWDDVETADREEHRRGDRPNHPEGCT